MGERIFFVKQLVKLIDKNEIHTIKVHGKEFVEVVRCKDCKHYGRLATKEERETSVDLVCDYWDSDGLAWYDFCSYGEKREENDG